MNPLEQLECRIDELMSFHETYMARLTVIQGKLQAQSKQEVETFDDYRAGYFSLADILEELGEVTRLIGNVQVGMADAVMRYIKE